MTRRKRLRKSRSKSDFNYSNLEPRQLLATLFTGTDGNDIATVTYVDESRVNVLIGETLTENVDITDGIRIDLGGNETVTSNTGEGILFTEGEDQITIDHRITGDLQIFNSEGIIVDGGKNQWQLGFVADPAATETGFGVGGVIAGRLNGNITFAGFTRVHSGNLGDTYTVNTTFVSGVTIYGGEGDDEFRFNANYDDSQLSDPRTRSGVNVLGGDGNDQFVYYQHARTSAFGGKGYDVVDYSRSQVDISFSFYGLRTSDGNVDGNDKIIGSSTQDNLIYVTNQLDLNWFINGKLARVLEPTSGVSIELENFNQFRAGSLSIDNFYVLRTARDIEILNADWLQVSSEIDPAEGNLDSIQNDIKISRTLTRVPGSSNPTEYYLNDSDGVQNPTVIISDATSDGTVAQFGKNKVISIMGSGNILFDLEFRTPFSSRDATERVPFEPNMSFHGSRAGDDVFIVRETWGETSIESHGGDDLFMVGSSNRDSNGALSKVTHDLNIKSGDGTDRMYVNNQEKTPVAFSSTVAAYFRVPSLLNYYSFSETFLVRSGLGSRTEIKFDTDLEFVRLNAATTGFSQVLVNPSETSQFVISGKADFDSQDIIRLTGTGYPRSSIVISQSDGTGSYGFSEEVRKRIYFYNMTATLTDFTGLNPIQVVSSIERAF